MATLGNNIKLLCRVNSISLIELSKKLGISRQKLYEIRNSCHPKEEMLIRIASALGVTPEVLLSNELEEKLALLYDSKNVGPNIVRLCKKNYLTIHAFTVKCNIPHSSIYDCINHGNLPGAYVLKLIAEWFGIPVLSLFTKPAEDINPIDYEKIAKNILSRCENEGISLNEFSKRAEISMPTVYKFVEMHKPVKVTTLLCFANAFGITVEELSS